MSRRDAALIALALTLLAMAGRRLDSRPSSPTVAARPPRLDQPLDGVTLPPNIAAPALRVEEPGTAYHLSLRGTRGKPLEVTSRQPGIRWPLGRWRALLAANRGGRLSLTVAVRSASGQWTRYRPIALGVAAEPIDRYLVYRWITPLYSLYRDVGLYQRDLSGYGVRTVLHGRQFNDGCVNCHAASPLGDRFALGFRSGVWGSGTLLATGSSIRRIPPLGFAAWHPNGRLLVGAVGDVRQFQHWAGEETREVIELASDLYYHDLPSGSLSPVPGLADPRWLETYPNWSPDGRWLYFSRALVPWSPDAEVPPIGYEQVRYALMRIAFDPATAAWGEPETVVPAAAGRSLVFPRVSPDGRYLLYTTCHHGPFPIHQPGSDLAMVDLRTGAPTPLPINSARADTWHSWSANGRWIAFTSKRADGLFAKVYLSYFDRAGRAHPPLLLPQGDPAFYDTLWYSYNVPELSPAAIRYSPAELGRAVRSAGRTNRPQPRAPQ